MLLPCVMGQVAVGHLRLLPLPDDSYGPLTNLSTLGGGVSQVVNRRVGGPLGHRPQLYYLCAPERVV